MEGKPPKPHGGLDGQRPFRRCDPEILASTFPQPLCVSANTAKELLDTTWRGRNS
jgi:hypothetical protein